MKSVNWLKPGYVNITCSTISYIPYNLIFTTKFNDSSITDLSQVTDKLDHIMLYQVHQFTSRWTEFELTTLLVINTDCTSSCISNYPAINCIIAAINCIIAAMQHLRVWAKTSWLGNQDNVFECNDIFSIISWRSVLLLQETRVPGENNWPVASHW
jgi:hypothetical protein